jgi:hypothetical protein
VERVVLLQRNDQSNRIWSEEDESKLSATRLVGIHSFRKIQYRSMRTQNYYK